MNCRKRYSQQSIIVLSGYFDCIPVKLEFREQTKNVFRAKEIVRATEKFLKDYRVIGLRNRSSRVKWYLAMEIRGFSRHMMRMTGPRCALSINAYSGIFKGTPKSGSPPLR